MVLEVARYRPVNEVVSRALDALRPPDLQTIPVKKAFGRVAAESVRSSMDVPQMSMSHMDGFAIRARDSDGATEASPKQFFLVGSVPLGKKPAINVGVGEAASVSTGSFLPPGADAVVPAEEARVAGRRLLLTRAAPTGSFVFGAGEDVRRGRLLIKKGETFRPQDVGMLVGLAIREVKVWKRPTVAVLATGSELTNSMSLGRHKTRNSHAPVFLAMVRALGCEALDLGIAPDTVSVIRRNLMRGLGKADVVLMTGGTSVGKLDLSDTVLAKLRPEVLYHGIRMDRGRVAGLAVIQGKGVVMMPGPIQGAMNAFFLLALPMIERSSGREGTGMTTRAKLTRRWEARKIFPNFTKVVYLKVSRSQSGTVAEPRTGDTESMSLLTDSNAYAVIPEEVTSLEPGDEVEARLLPGFSYA